MDDISQGIGSVDISGEGLAAVAKCDTLSKREDTISEKECTSCDQKLDNIKTNDVGVDTSATDMVVSLCANCGKEGASNICNKCKQVTYCNAACKKRHRHKHKKDCEEHLKRLTELQEEENKRAAGLHDIELFKRPPPRNDCPICFLLLPTLCTGSRYQSCCGKVICSGCFYAPRYNDQGKAIDNMICPFCRTPTLEDVDDDVIERMMKRVEINDAQAINCLASYYSQGMYGLRQDHAKALQLQRRAAELGCGDAYHNIGVSYHLGDGVEREMKKAVYYYELAAMRGNVAARHFLGMFEDNSDNMERALKHYMIAVEDGCSESLKEVQDFYSKGIVSKDIYVKALRSYQNYLNEVKSSQRDVAATAREDCKYID